MGCPKGTVLGSNGMCNKCKSGKYDDINGGTCIGYRTINDKTPTTSKQVCMV
jgi:hypothetical protein